MEPFNAGWLSLLPPAAAIVAALISREVISALLVGILTGAVIYTSSTGGGRRHHRQSGCCFFDDGVDAGIQNPHIHVALRSGGLFGLSLGRFKSLRRMGRAANEDEAEVLAFGLRAWLSCVY